MSFVYPSRRPSLLVVVGTALLAVSLSACGVFGSNENPPSPPGNLQLSASQDGVQISWEGSSEATGYNIYRAEESITDDLSNAATVNGQPLEGATSFQDNSAQNTTVYYYRVTAVNDDGESDPSSGAQVRMPFPESPDRPGN